jgi:hypothetical protein
VIVGTLVLVAIVIGGLLFVDGIASPKHDMTGTITVTDLTGNCLNDIGYADIRSGTEVTVSNENTTIIANGSLASVARSGYSCAWSFTINGVPKATFYQIEVSHRGKVQFSDAQLQAQNWAVALTLGR